MTTQENVGESTSHRQPKGITPEIKRIADEFSQATLPRLRALQNFFPPEASPETVGEFLVQVVAQQLQKRLAPKRLCPGILHQPKNPSSYPNCQIIEAIIHDPTKGPPTIENGRLAVLSPDVCAGAIDLRPWVANLDKLETKLALTQKAHFPSAPSGRVMGVLVRDPEPIKKSDIWKKGRHWRAYDHAGPYWCPVYILFSYKAAQYEPHQPAIEALFANIHDRIHPLY
jgi:hypothetical protein